MKVAAYQAPLLSAGSMLALDLIQDQVAYCEANGIAVLCCPEAILGGLADYCTDPGAIAIRTDDGSLASVLAPIASENVTCIVGFTEAARGQIYNAAAVFQRGRVTGLYRKLHPAIRRSVYTAGSETPVFKAGEFTFGIVLCNDSNFAEPAQAMAAQGATAIFVPTNNGLPGNRTSPKLVDEATKADRARACENQTWIIRADVAGDNGELSSFGSSAIVAPDGTVVRRAKQLSPDLLVADIPVSRRMR